MATPQGISYDRLADLTFGLDAYSAGGQAVSNGVALVTGWLSNAPWGICYDQPSTSWSQCAADPSTTWEDCS